MALNGSAQRDGVKRDFYMMDYEAWDEGTFALSLEEEAAFLRLCNQMYRFKGALKNNERLLCSIWRCHPNKARHLLKRLMDEGKIQLTPDGCLTNARVTWELDRRDIQGRQKADAGYTGGIRSGDSRRQRKDAAHTEACAAHTEATPVEAAPDNTLKNNGSNEAPASGDRTIVEYSREEKNREEKSILEADAGRADARQVFSQWDFVSDDGSVSFTADEIANIERDLPALKNVRGAIRLAARTWAMDLPALRRKKAIISHLAKKEQEAIERQERADRRENERRQKDEDARLSASKPKLVRPAW